MTPTLNMAVRTIAMAASDDTAFRTSKVSNTAARTAAIIAPMNRPFRPPQTKPIAMPGKTAWVSPSLMNSSPRKVTSTPTTPATTLSTSSTMSARAMKG